MRLGPFDVFIDQRHQRALSPVLCETQAGPLQTKEETSAGPGQFDALALNFQLMEEL